MGEIALVDPDRLRTVADAFSDTAADVATARWPELDGAALTGSAVAAVVVAEILAEPTRNLAAELTAWAEAARTSAEAFRSADIANGERFGLR